MTMKASTLIEHMIAQHRVDLSSAHAEICKLQGLDPETNTWPDWTPQANTLRWFKRIEAEHLPAIRASEHHQREGNG